MLNHHLFSLINAPPGLTPGQLFLPMAVARWSACGVMLGLVLSWLIAERELRAELVKFAAGAVIALLLAAAVAIVVGALGPSSWSRDAIPGTRYLARGWLPDLPSPSVTMLWAVAITAFGQDRLSVAGPFLLTLGLAVGWSRIYLGASLPGDILAALPVAAAASALTWWMRGPVHRLALRLDEAHGGRRPLRRRPDQR
jgi:undecaprenyl-diphosphatase